jgi:hypothetical protein
VSTPIYEGTNPLIQDTLTDTYTAGEDLVPGVVVEITADNTVKKPTAANSLKIAGITMTKALNGGQVTVIGPRAKCRATAWGTINAGDQITNAPTSGGNGLGKIMTDNSSKNTSIFAQCRQGASSGGTAIIKLW